METVNEFASLFRKDYDKMKEADIQTCIRNYLTSGEFNYEAYHPARSTSRIEGRRQSNYRPELPSNNRSHKYE